MRVDITGPTWYKLRSNLSINLIGRISIRNKHPDRVLPYWVLGIIHSGGRSIQVENTVGRLGVGDYFLLPPNFPHHGIEEEQHDVSFLHFFMDGEPIPEPKQIDSATVMLPIFGTIPTYIDISNNIQYLYHHYHTGIGTQAFYCIQLQAILSQLSLHMQILHLQNNRERKLGNEIFQFIQENLTDNLNADIFEREFGLSYRQLNIIFKNLFRTTIKQKIIELRINNALNILMHGGSIANAAEQSGFNDYFYFLKCFKKIKSFTPGEMRNNFFGHRDI